jgi:hypothetical protein
MAGHTVELLAWCSVRDWHGVLSETGMDGLLEMRIAATMGLSDISVVKEYCKEI